MEKVQCINLHWFDAEKYVNCPLCGASKSDENKSMNTSGTVEPECKSKGWRLFPSRKPKSDDISQGSVEEDSDIPITKSLKMTKQEQVEVKSSISFDYTISYLFSEEAKMPVTAWLVGVSGKNSGRSYVVKPGMNLLANTFGKVATITYEPATRRFVIDGAESEIYCNGFRVGSKRELGAYDLIEIENNKYIFVPFCGPTFDWDTYK